MDRSTNFLNPQQLLNSWWINQASLLSFLLNCSSTDPRRLHKSKPFMLNTWLNTSICRDLLNSYINIQSDSVLTFLDLSLSTDPSLHLPDTLFSLQTFNPRDFRPLLASNHLVCSLISSFFMQFMHLDQSFGVFEKNLGFFKIFEFLLKFWDGFLFTLSLNLMHCIT